MGENDTIHNDSSKKQSEENNQKTRSEMENLETDKVEVEVLPPESETSKEESETAAPEESVVALLKEEIQKVQAENASLKDTLARALADFQNLKRRTAAEYSTLKRESVKNFVLKILNPLDNLDRVVVPNPAPEVKPFVDGVKMIQNEIQSVLEKEGIIKLEVGGQPFDPSQMEAIASEESEEYSEEIVIEVFRSGYAFTENNEKIPLRPALVKVGKPKI